MIKRRKRLPQRLTLIRSLLDEPEKAEEALNHFAGFLRGSVDMLEETVCISASRERFSKSGRSNPYEIQLIRDTAKKGEAALFIVIATLFQNTLDDAILGAVEGAICVRSHNDSY